MTSSELKVSPENESTDDENTMPESFFPTLSVSTSFKKSKKKNKKSKKPKTARVSGQRKSGKAGGKHVDRPMSAREKLRQNLVELDQYSLLTSGCKTDKERRLAQAVQTLITRINDKDSQMKSSNSALNAMRMKFDAMEASSMKAKKTLYQEQKLRTTAISDRQRIKAVMAKIQRAVSARLKLLGIDFDNITSIGEALDASLKAINSLIAQLQDRDELIGELRATNRGLLAKVESQKEKIARLQAAVAAQKEEIEANKNEIEDQSQIIEDLRQRNKELTDENNNLKDELAALKQEFNDFKRATQEQMDALRKNILQVKEDNVEKDGRIAELEERIRELEALLAKKKSNINDLSARVKELENMLADRDHTVEQQNEELRIKDMEIDRLLAIINKPKISTGVQTNISGAIDQQLSDYPRLLKEIVALKHLLDKKNQRIRDLEEENRQLLLDMEWLLKRAAAFRRDSSNHTGQVWQMCSAPNKYMIATGSTDMTVRLWKCNPRADKKLKQKLTQIYRRSDVDGKVESLCWSKDGSLLAVGTGFRDGAEGYIVIWNMEGDNMYDVRHAIRSRPTTRFGRAMAITFSPENDFIYAGDTVGSIWCFSLKTECIVGLLQLHTDVIHDVTCNPNGSCLYSVGLDMSLAVFELPVKCGGQIIVDTLMVDGNVNNDMDAKEVMQASKKSRKSRKSKRSSKMHERTRSKSKAGSQKVSRGHQSYSSMTLKDLLKEAVEDEYETYEGTTLVTDAKYAYWRVAVSDDGRHVCCATRKLQIYPITGPKTVDVGPNVSDMDMDHVRSLHLRNGLMLVSRAGCNRAKLFDIATGKEVKKMSCKVAVAQADFLYDNAFIVILQQLLVPNEPPKPPKMTLCCYDKEVGSNAGTPLPDTPTKSRISAFPTVLPPLDDRKIDI